MEIERDLAPFGHSPSPSPSPSPQPPIDYDVEVDPDNMVIRGGGDAYDTEIDPDNMVVPGSRAVTPNYDDEGVYQAHTWVRSHAPWTIHKASHQATPADTTTKNTTQPQQHPEAESAPSYSQNVQTVNQLSFSHSPLYLSISHTPVA